MSLTIVVRGTGRPAEGPAEPPSITLEAPRLVIGRGEGCELCLPDPSVSRRHASLRQRGTEWVVMDEGSTNGTFLGKVKLPAMSARAIRPGELVRVGRVWLELRIGQEAAAAAPVAAAKTLALALVTHALAAQGEDGRPRVRLAEGPGAGAELRLAEPGRRYVVGRGREADLVLADEGILRRHLGLSLEGEQVMVTDLSGKGGATLGGAALPAHATAWRPGQPLALGAMVLSLEHAAAEALAELERGPDETLAPAERFELPEGPKAAPAEPQARPSRTGPAASVSPREPAPAEREPEPEPGGWGLADGAVVLTALGVLAASAAGLWWLLRR